MRWASHLTKACIAYRHTHTHSLTHSCTIWYSSYHQKISRSIKHLQDWKQTDNRDRVLSPDHVQHTASFHTNTHRPQWKVLVLRWRSVSNYCDRQWMKTLDCSAMVLFLLLTDIHTHTHKWKCLVWVEHACRMWKVSGFYSELNRLQKGEFMYELALIIVSLTLMEISAFLVTQTWLTFNEGSSSW